MERDYVAPIVQQGEAIRVKQREEKRTWDIKEYAGLQSFLSFHHRGAEVRHHAPN